MKVPTQFSKEFIPGNVKTAMTDDKGQPFKSGDLWKVPVGDLHIVPGLNVRTKSDEYEAHINRVAKSIFEEGYYPDKAIAVFINEDNKVCIRDGHTRYEAVLRAIKMGAQITTIPCVTAPKGTTMVDMTIGLVKSNEGKPLQPIEVAVVCKRLLGWGWEVSQIAERLDYTTPYVNDLLGLLEAPEAMQQLVSAGKVSASTAIKATKRDGVAKATETLVAASKASKDGKVAPKALKALKPVKEVATESDLRKALKLVFNDPAFNKLSDKAQDAVLRLVG